MARSTTPVDSYTSYTIAAQVLTEGHVPQTPTQYTPTYLSTPSTASSSRSASSSSTNLSLIAALEQTSLDGIAGRIGIGQSQEFGGSGPSNETISPGPSLSRKSSRPSLRLSKPPISFPLPKSSLPSSPISTRLVSPKQWKDAHLVLLIPKVSQDSRFKPTLEIRDETALMTQCDLSQLFGFEQLQRTHFSLFGKRSVLSIRFSDSAEPTLSSSTTPAGQSRPRSATLRRRTLTVSIPNQTPSVIHLGFKTPEQVHHWHALLRYAITPYAVPQHATTRPYRQLRIVVLDAHELSSPSAPKTPTNGRFSQQQSQRDDGSSMRSGDASLSASGQSRRLTKRDSSDLFSRGNKIVVEVVLDRIVMARTAETTQEDSPFWGETFNFEGLPKVERCALHIYKASRLAKGQLPSGIGDLTLVDRSEGREQDQRYPLRSYQTGEVIGEIRTAVMLEDVTIRLRSGLGEIINALAGPEGRCVIYDLTSKDELDCGDGLCRVLHANGSLVPVLSEMCEYEAAGARSTLFRPNTPLTHLLEATMRLFCGEFLTRSVGSTVNRIINNRIRCEIDSTKARFGVGKAEGALRVKEGTNVLLGLAEQCFADLYAKRDLLPDLLRQVFRALMVAVNKHNPDDTDRIRYKAVSSFLFLRLIGPAIMRPYLFGLTSGIPPITVQRTLTLLAKVMHGLAFFTGRESFKEELLHSFAPFFRAHEDSMMDYLKNVADVAISSRASSTIKLPSVNLTSWSLLQKEAATLPTSIAIDPAADSAILLMRLGHKRRRSDSRSSVENRLPGTYDEPYQSSQYTLDVEVDAEHVPQ